MVSNNRPFPEDAKSRITMIKIVPDRIAYFVSMGEKPVKYIWEAAKQ
jgi:hypothetical protein